MTTDDTTQVKCLSTFLVLAAKHLSTIKDCVIPSVSSTTSIGCTAELIYKYFMRTVSKKKTKKTWNNSNWQKQNKKQEMKRRNILELILSKVCDSGAQLSHVTCFKTPFQFSLCAASSAASLLFECAHFNQSIPGDRRLKITDPQNSLW